MEIEANRQGRSSFLLIEPAKIDNSHCMVGVRLTTKSAAADSALLGKSIRKPAVASCSAVSRSMRLQGDFIVIAAGANKLADGTPQISGA